MWIFLAAAILKSLLLNTVMTVEFGIIYYFSSVEENSEFFEQIPKLTEPIDYDI